MIFILLTIANEVVTGLSYGTVAAIAGGVATPFIGAIITLWSRIDASTKKCHEEREAIAKERVTENKEWFARVEALHKESAVKTEKMFDHLVKMTEKSEEAKYATIKAITDFNSSVIRLEKSVSDLAENTTDAYREMKVIYDRRS